jgi:hypothetical protein
MLTSLGLSNEFAGVSVLLVVYTKYLIPGDNGLNGLYIVSIGNNFLKAFVYGFVKAEDVADIYSTIEFRLYSRVAPTEVVIEEPFLSKSLVELDADIIPAPGIY